MNQHTLYPGIQLSFLSASDKHLPCFHESLDHILEIHYCHRGHGERKLANGNIIYLGSGDFSLHTMKTCCNSTLSFPNGSYVGLILYIDLQKLSDDPPNLLSETGITGETLYQKFCFENMSISFPGNEETAAIFSPFFTSAPSLQAAYWKIKTIELLLYLSQLPLQDKLQLYEYQSEQIAIIRQIHEHLITHMAQRYTIESLSREYHINPTTLKNVFKSVYGTSMAAHIRAHRLEKASELLRTTTDSISSIATVVGYENQSRFSMAFKKTYGILPTEYRKRH